MFCVSFFLTSFPNILNWKLNDSVNADNMFNNFSKNALSEQKLEQYKKKVKTKSFFINKTYNETSDSLFSPLFDIFT